MLNVKKIKPLFTHLVVTMDQYNDDVSLNGIIDTHRRKGSIKEFQTVVAVGPLVREIKVGDLVSINPKRYRILKHQEGSLKDGVITDNPVTGYNIPTVTIDGVPHMFLDLSDIEYVIEDYEETDDSVRTTDIYTPPTDIIV